MAPTVPTYIPDELTAGQTWKFRLSYGDFPAGDGWALAIYFRGAGTLDATMGDDARIVAVGDAFEGTIAPADTSIAEGVYEWLAEASKDGETYTAGSGSTRVRPKLSAAAAGARQSFEEAQLALVESEIAARLTGDGSANERYAIGSASGARELERVPLAELYTLRAKLKAAVIAQQHGGRLPPVDVHFTRPR